MCFDQFQLGVGGRPFLDPVKEQFLELGLSTVDNYLMLPTVRELKKTAPAYRRPESGEHDHE